MTIRSVFLPLAAAACLGVLAPSAARAAGVPSAPTFTKDVAPILMRSCVQCHRPGQVAPMSLLLVAAWLVTIALRRAVSRTYVLRYVWHPALLVFSVYIIVLSSMVLAIAY